VVASPATGEGNFVSTESTAPENPPVAEPVSTIDPPAEARPTPAFAAPTDPSVPKAPPGKSDTPGAMPSSATSTPSDKPAIAVPAVPGSSFVAGKSSEVKTERSLNAKTFANPDGTQSAKVYSSPIHYADDKGVLQEIDSTIVPAAKGFKNAAGAQTISFAASADSSEIVKIKNPKHEVSFSMQGARAVKPKVEGSKITYPAVGEGVDLVYVLGSDTLKELVVLHNRPEPETSPIFRFDLHAGDLIPKTTSAGGIDLVDSKGAIQFQIPPGMAMDSNPDPAKSGFGPASLELVREGKGWVVTLKSTAAWLDAPEREYPVYLDPSVYFGNFRQGGGYDAFVASGNPNANFHQYWLPTYEKWVNYVGNIFVEANTYARFELNLNRPGSCRDFIAWKGCSHERQETSTKEVLTRA
jgi:hypothetical protein